MALTCLQVALGFRPHQFQICWTANPSSSTGLNGPIPAALEGSHRGQGKITKQVKPLLSNTRSKQSTGANTRVFPFSAVPPHHLSLISLGHILDLNARVQFCKVSISEVTNRDVISDLFSPPAGSEQSCWTSLSPGGPDETGFSLFTGLNRQN